jgi:hypothetical protein
MVLLVLVFGGLSADAAPSELVARFAIDTFDTGAGAWRLEQVEAGSQAQYATEGKAALRVLFPAWRQGRSRWPALMLDYGQGGFGVTDWGAYDALCFSVYNEGARPLLLKLRVDDATGKRVVHSFHLLPGQQRQCRVPVAELAWGIDVSQVVHINLFMTQPPEAALLHFDDMRLEADAVGGQVDLLGDPLGGGLIQVRLRSGRRVQADIAVRDEAGTLRDRYVAVGRALDWKRQHTLPAGRYTVEAQLRDMEWDAAPLKKALGSFVVQTDKSRANLALWPISVLDKITLEEGPPPGRAYLSGRDTLIGSMPPVRIDMARNEYEAVQVVLRSVGPRSDFSLRWEVLRHEETGEHFPLAKAAVYPVGYVRTKRPDLYAVEREGWWPDPLLPPGDFAPESGLNQPLWLELKSEKGTKPGLYTGHLGLYRQDLHMGQVPVEVRVYDAVLPDTNAVGTAFAFYPDAIERLYGGADATMLRRYWDFLDEHRVGLDHLYRRRPPTGAEIDFWRVTSDPSFNLLNVAPRAYAEADLEGLATDLQPVVESLRDTDQIGRAYLYGFDEARSPDFGDLQAAFSFFKGRFPDLRTFTTAIDPSLGLDSGLAEVVDIWAPLLPFYDRGDAIAARQRGLEVWWYLCIAPTHPFPNWFIEYPASGARLVWWMGYRQKVDGLLYYNINRWPGPRRPLRLIEGAKTDWDPVSYGTANGDGCLLYGGAKGPIASLRLKLVRDGIEDVGLLRLLEDQLVDGGARSRQLCDLVAPGLDQYAKDPKLIEAARIALLTELELSKSEPSQSER